MPVLHLGGFLMLPARLIGALVIGAAIATNVTAAENPQVTALHNEIKALRVQEKAVLKTIHAWYESFIKRDKLTEAILIEERKAIHRQEEELLAMASTQEDRDAIRAQYDTLRAIL